MNYVITRLDRRYAWHRQFPYMIEFHKNRSWQMGTGVIDFDRVRKWMNECWGWSQDIETRADLVKVIAGQRNTPWPQAQARAESSEHVNTHWAYSCRYQEYRIYVSESALSLFKLRWSSDNDNNA